MQVKKLSKQISKLTADEGMWLTRYYDGVGDLLFYSSSKTFIGLNSICNTYREITDAENTEYLVAKAELEAQLPPVEEGGDGGE